MARSPGSQPALREDALRRKDRKAYARTALRAERQKRAEQRISRSNVAAHDVAGYTVALGQVLFEHVLDGLGLEAIASLPGMPAQREMKRWIGDKAHPFRVLYYEAKRLMIPSLEEQILREATEPRLGVRTRNYMVVDRDGNEHDMVETIESDNVERSKLRVLALQNTLSWMNPAKHGPRAVPPAEGGAAQLEALFAALQAGPAAEEEEEE